jgi:hypothetical protein
MAPIAGVELEPSANPGFAWSAAASAVLYRVEFQDMDGRVLLEALVPGGQTSYTVPPILRERAGAASFRWRVVALGVGGRMLDATPWREIRFGGTGAGK